MKTTTIVAIVFIILGFISSAFFVLSPAFSLPQWGKISCGILWIIHSYSSLNADNWEQEGKLSISPILSFIVQLGLSFLLVAITS